MTDLFLRPLFTWRSAVASKHGPKNPTTRHVLLTLGLYMSDKGDSCFPATRTLAESTGLSHRAVITHLREAADAGWIGKRERPLKDGKGWRRMEYFATIPAAAEAAFRGERDSPPYRDEPSSPAIRGERGSDRGERGDTVVVNDVHLNSSVNSSRSSKPLCPLAADLFEQAMREYPKRAGNDPKRKTVRAWNAQIRAGTQAAAMVDGTRRYRAFCEATGKIGTETVMMAATFFGPDKPFEQGWALPAAPTKATGPAKPWYIRSADAIRAKGDELGEPPPGDDEPFPSYRARVNRRAGVTDDMIRQAEADWR